MHGDILLIFLLGLTSNAVISSLKGKPRAHEALKYPHFATWGREGGWVCVYIGGTILGRNVTTNALSKKYQTHKRVEETTTTY